MSEVISHEYHLPHSIISTQLNSIPTRQKSPQHIKQSLIDKIQNILHKNDQLQISLDQLQNTICDLRKLVEITGNQNEQANQHLHKQICELQGKKQSYQKALKSVYHQGNHMRKCMLFWKEFL